MLRHIATLLGLALALSAAAQEPMTLRQCQDMALEHNRTLQNAALSILSSREQLTGAKANRLPQISANVMAFQAFDKIVRSDGTYPQELAALAQVNPAFGQLAGQPYSLHELSRAYAATLSAIQPLYTGGKIRTGIKLATLQTDVAQLQQQLQRKDLMQKIAENYWNIATMKYHKRTVEAAQRQLDTLHTQVSLFVEAGVTTRNALLQVRLRQQELASKRLSLDNGERLLRLLLAQQIGAGSADFDIAVPESGDIAPLPLPVSAQDAAQHREELLLAGKNVEASQLQVDLKRAGQLPTLAIGLMGYHTGLGGISEATRQYVPTHMTNALALVTLSVPISAWWGPEHRALKQQQIALRMARNDYDDAREQLAIDTESAWLNLTEARKQIDIAQASVDEARENYRMSQQQYRMGTETIANLLDAETLQRQALDNLDAAIADYHIRLADYQRKTQY